MLLPTFQIPKFFYIFGSLVGVKACGFQGRHKKISILYGRGSGNRVGVMIKEDDAKTLFLSLCMLQAVTMGGVIVRAMTTKSSSLGYYYILIEKK